MFFSSCYILQWKELYREIDSGDCTDPITTNMLLNQLDPLVGQWEIMLATMVLMWFFTAVSYGYRKYYWMLLK